MSLVDKLKKNVLYLLIGCLLTAYLVARAIILPITIDEGGTFYNAVPRSVWDIITYVDPSPNNHILNTLLIKFFVSIFGAHSLIIRLPNILAFILYFTVAVIWLKKLNTNKLFVFFGIVVLTCNPYMLDFFALARGYALSISFMFSSMYLAYLYFTSKQIKSLYFAFIVAAPAVYSNFTMLNFYLSMLVVCSIFLLKDNWNKPVKIVFKQFLVIIGISGLLVFLCYIPLNQITSNGQLRYWSSNGFYPDTFIPLVAAMIYGNAFFYSIKPQIYSIIVIVSLIGISIYDLRNLIKNKFNFGSDFLLFSLLVFGGTISVVLLQFYILNIPFLNARGAIFLYVLFVIPFIYFFNSIFIKGYKWKNWMVIPFILLGSYHLLSSINFYNCREWWFDADTKNVLSYLESKHAGEEITLNTYWIYNTSFQFHIDERQRENIKLAPYHQDLWPDSNYLYYYCERAQVVELEKNYREVISFNGGNNVLMKKR